MRGGMRRSLTAAQQFLGLRTNPVCAGAGSVKAGELVWRYAASPTPLSRSYAVRVAFQQGSTPRVFVDAPDLAALAEGRRLPHVYEQGPARLCLYLPRRGEWERWMPIDRTIVPWTALWLFYFEDWLEFGEWGGGGEHPGEFQKRRRSRGRVRHPPPLSGTVGLSG